MAAVHAIASNGILLSVVGHILPFSICGSLALAHAYGRLLSIGQMVVALVGATVVLLAQEKATPCDRHL